MTVWSGDDLSLEEQTLYASPGTAAHAGQVLKAYGAQPCEQPSDLEGRAELMAMGYDSTPVTVIGANRIEGFDAELIDEALAESGESSR